jgi:hypothetical protein
VLPSMSVKRKVTVPAGNSAVARGTTPGAVCFAAKTFLPSLRGGSADTNGEWHPLPVFAGMPE